MNECEWHTTTNTNAETQRHPSIVVGVRMVLCSSLFIMIMSSTFTRYVWHSCEWWWWWWW